MGRCWNFVESESLEESHFLVSTRTAAVELTYGIGRGISIRTWPPPQPVQGRKTRHIRSLEHEPDASTIQGPRDDRLQRAPDSDVLFQRRPAQCKRPLRLTHNKDGEIIVKGLDVLVLKGGALGHLAEALLQRVGIGSKNDHDVAGVALHRLAKDGDNRGELFSPSQLLQHLLCIRILRIQLQ
jgi:hypothetical protein